MPTTVDTTREFDRELERLARRFSAVLDAVDTLILQMESDSRPGDRIQHVGGVAYKVRLPNRSARRGKSGGFRVIYYLRSPQQVFLVTIYSKSERDDISSAEIRRIISDIP